MDKCSHYKWKGFFFVLISILAFIGYRYSHVTMTNPVIAAVDSHDMAVVSKDDLYPIIHDYIINHPEVILQSMEQMQKRKMDEISAQIDDIVRNNKDAIEDVSNTPYFGNKDGDIKIVMFYDYGCSYCQKANDSLNQLLSADKNIMVIYRPIAVLGEKSDYIAKLMFAVQKSHAGKFKTIHDSILGQGKANKEEIAAIIKQNGLSIDLLEQDMNSKEVQEMMIANSKLAEIIKVNGVPVFVIDSGFYQGAMELDMFNKTINDIRNKKPQ